MLATIGSQLGQFIGRKQTEDQLRLTEEQFRQAQKMEAVSRFAGGIAHDFNNLLTGILGYSYLLASSLKSSDPGYEKVMEIRKAAERAGLLTRQLLAFSRKQVLAAKVLDVNTIITDTERMLRRLIGEDIQLVTVFASNLGKFTADPGQIEQVILNLAVNARDSMPKGGKLTIETANFQLDSGHAQTHPKVAPGQYVLLTVRDTGSGMDEATKARIFEPFFTTKAFGKGTGLGLATVYGIVKRGGSRASRLKPLGRGTTCRIYFPRTEGEVPMPKSSSTRRQSSLREGNGVTGRGRGRSSVPWPGKRLKCGYTVLEACKPEEAIRLADQHQEPIHLLLSDVVMPGMGGGQLRGTVDRFAARHSGDVYVGIHG